MLLLLPGQEELNAIRMGFHLLQLRHFSQLFSAVLRASKRASRSLDGVALPVFLGPNSKHFAKTSFSNFHLNIKALLQILQFALVVVYRRELPLRDSSLIWKLFLRRGGGGGGRGRVGERNHGSAVYSGPNEDARLWR